MGLNGSSTGYWDLPACQAPFTVPGSGACGAADSRSAMGRKEPFPLCFNNEEAWGREALPDFSRWTPRIPDTQNNFAGSEIGRALARSAGVRARDGAHQKKARLRGPFAHPIPGVRPFRGQRHKTALSKFAPGEFVFDSLFPTCCLCCRRYQTGFRPEPAPAWERIHRCPNHGAFHAQTDSVTACASRHSAPTASPRMKRKTGFA